MWIPGKASSRHRAQHVQGPRGEISEETKAGAAVVWGPAVGWGPGQSVAYDKVRKAGPVQNRRAYKLWQGVWVLFHVQ